LRDFSILESAQERAEFDRIGSIEPETGNDHTPRQFVKHLAALKHLQTSRVARLEAYRHPRALQARIMNYPPRDEPFPRQEGCRQPQSA